MTGLLAPFGSDNVPLAPMRGGRRREERGAWTPMMQSDRKYLEHDSRGEFVELALEGQFIFSRRGKIGRVAAQREIDFDSQPNARSVFLELIADLERKGFKEKDGAVDQSDAPKAERVALAYAERKEFVDVSRAGSVLHFRVGTLLGAELSCEAGWASDEEAARALSRLQERMGRQGFEPFPPPEAARKQAKAIFVKPNELDPVTRSQLMTIPGASAHQNAQLALIEGDLDWEGDVDLGLFSLGGLISAIVVTGSLHVPGTITHMRPHPEYLLVKQDIECGSLIHGSPHTYVVGNLHCRHLLYCRGNDGSLRIDGSARGCAGINDDLDLRAFDMEFAEFYDSDEGDRGRFLPELWDSDGSIDEALLLDLARQGKSPLLGC